MAAPDLSDLGQSDYSFDQGDFKLTLEDEFVLARIQNELKAATDIEQLRTGATLLLKLAVMGQAMIRGLINRIGALEQKQMSPDPKN
jgi:hypothetical protein